MLLPIAFHLLPLLPLYWERYPLTAASVLLVLLPYIKCAKLNATYKHIKSQNQKDWQALQEIDITKKRWAKLTFLPLREKFSGNKKHSQSKDL